MFWKLRWRHFAVSWLVSPLDGVFSLMENESHLTWKRSRDCSDLLVAIFSFFFSQHPPKWAIEMQNGRGGRSLQYYTASIRIEHSIHLQGHQRVKFYFAMSFFFLLRLIVSWRKSSTEKRHLRDKTSQALIAHR